jgi:hypothetical protein
MRIFTVRLKIFLDGDALPAERSLIGLFLRIESREGVDAGKANEVIYPFLLTI